MSTDLQFLIERARSYKMTGEEREEQARSFAYGNTRLDNDNITRADIDEAARTMKDEEKVEPVSVCS
jgi:hypothetical protein